MPHSEPKDKHICFYFEFHRPYRLSKANIFDVGEVKSYFTGSAGRSNKDAFNRLAKASYTPAVRMLLRAVQGHKDFHCSVSFSGTFLEQCSEFNPKLLKLLKDLVDTGKVEVLSETYYHSLASFFSPEEFAEQIILHRKLIWETFRKKTRIFRNSELIYNNYIASFIKKLGYSGILAQGIDDSLGVRSPNFVYTAKSEHLTVKDESIASENSFAKHEVSEIAVLARNTKLSDDLAYHFSNKGSSKRAITPSKFVGWIEQAEGNTINLFMDIETFGVYQKRSSGIFPFFPRFIRQALKSGIGFRTPSDTIKHLKPVGELNIKDAVSWINGYDLSLWVGNEMQRSSGDTLYEMEQAVKKKYKKEDRRMYDRFLNIWRKLQASDYFQAMSTELPTAAGGETPSPYEMYINYMNVISDFGHKLKEYKRNAKV